MLIISTEFVVACISIVVLLPCTGLATAARPVRCDGGTGTINMLALSPDGRIVAAGGKEPVVRLWDTSNGSEIRSISLFASAKKDRWLEALAFSRDGKELALAAHGEPIKFIDPTTGTKIGSKRPINVQTAAYDLAYSRDGTMLAIADGRSLRIWDTALQQQIHQFDVSKAERIWRVAEVAFSPDGKSVAAALQDLGGRVIKEVPRLRVWNVASGEMLFDVWEDNGSDTAIAISPDGRFVAESGRGYPGQKNVWKEFPGAVFVWNIVTKQLQYRVPADKVVTTCLAFSPQGGILVTGGNGTSLKVWNAENGNFIRELRGHRGRILDLEFSRDGQKLASLDTDGEILIWTIGESLRRK